MFCVQCPLLFKAGRSAVVGNNHKQSIRREKVKINEQNIEENIARIANAVQCHS